MINIIPSAQRNSENLWQKNALGVFAMKKIRSMGFNMVERGVNKHRKWTDIIMRIIWIEWPLLEMLYVKKSRFSFTFFPKMRLKIFITSHCLRRSLTHSLPPFIMVSGCCWQSTGEKKTRWNYINSLKKWRKHTKKKTMPSKYRMKVYMYVRAIET